MLTILDTVNAIERKYTAYAVDVTAPAGASAEVAAAAAAHGVLERLYPQQKGFLMLLLPCRSRAFLKTLCAC